jgi:transposase
MFGWGPATRIYLAAGVTDMRKGFEGLYGLARDRMQCEPLSGHIFVFANAQRNQLKLLFWDGSGLQLYYYLLDVNRPSSKPLSEAERIIQLEKKLAWAELRIQMLEERLRLQRIKKYGPASEKLNAEQLELLELEPGVSNVEVAAEAEREALPARPARKRRPHPGRQELPADLPRVERVIACTPAQCTCAACGEPTAVIGYDTSEQLDVEPVKYFVLVSRREKRACPHCQQGGVAAAPVAARIVDKGLVSDRVVIDTVVAKYSDHLPLYRQSAILERETGVEIGRATMDGWVMRVGELLIPVAGAIRRELLAGG